MRDIEDIMKDLADLAEAGKITNVKINQSRKVQFDMRGVPLKEQTEPTDVKLSFRYGGGK